MNSWDVDKPGRVARAKATKAFCDYLADPLHDAERQRWTAVPHTQISSDEAKAKFADLGGFLLQINPNTPLIKPIPANTVFKIYEPSPEPNRDEIVTIVLPDKVEGVPPEGLFVARDFYRCSYWPY